MHVIALSGESGRFLSLNSPEVAWLEADLAAAAAARERGEIGWIISHVHYPQRTHRILLVDDALLLR